MLKSRHNISHDFDDYQSRVDNNEHLVICMQRKSLMDLARGLWITIDLKE